MKKNLTIHKKITLFLLTFLTLSCSSNLDFSQAEDLVLTPVIVANLTYFDVPAPDFVTDGVETTVAVGVEEFDVFKDQFFKDNLKKAAFFFEITNTINRDYLIQLFYFDKENQILHRTDFTVPAAEGAPQVITQTELFENATLDLLKQTDKMGFRIIMGPGTPLTESSIGNLKLKSSATLYMEIE